MKKLPLAKILTNIRLKWLIFTLLVLVVLVKLALWQVSRAEEKQLRLNRIAQLQHQQAFSFAEVLQPINANKLTYLADELDSLNDIPVRLSAIFDASKVFLLDNQVNNNQLGYRVFQLAYAQEQAFLVNLGWVQGSIDRQQLPNITPLSGEYLFSGHIRVPERGIMLQAQNFTQIQWPLRVQQIELDKFAKLLNISILPFVIYVAESEEIGFAKKWQPIVMPPEKHQAYAVQWFALALAWLLLMLWALIKSSQEPHENNNKVS